VKVYWIDELLRLGACAEAIAWAKKYNSLEDAWQSCSNGGWMLWLAGRVSSEPFSDIRRSLVLALCECIKLKFELIPIPEIQLLIAIETAERWARGDTNVSFDMLRAAANDTCMAYGTARSRVLACINNAVSCAIATAYWSNTTIAHTVVWSLVCITDRLDVDALQLQCANIIRKYYPTAPDIALCNYEPAR